MQSSVPPTCLLTEARPLVLLLLLLPSCNPPGCRYTPADTQLPPCRCPHLRLSPSSGTVPPAGAPSNAVAVTATLCCLDAGQVEGQVALMMGGAKVSELAARAVAAQQSIELRDGSGQPLQEVRTVRVPP